MAGLETAWREITWRQFGAAIDMLGNALAACPDTLWGEFWRLAYHTLFYLDMYLDENPAGFRPPAPFSAELRRLEAPAPADGAYGREALAGYLSACREKCRSTIGTLTEEAAGQPCGLDWLDLSRGELLLYNMRHVQHHAAQLNLRLRQTTGAAPPDWVARV